MAHHKTLVTSIILFVVVMMCVAFLILLETNHPQFMKDSDVHNTYRSILSARGALPPVIENYTPTSDFITISEGESQRFNITASVVENATTNITWYLDGQLVSASDNYTSGNYTFVSNYSSAEGGSAGVYNITVYLVYNNISGNISVNISRPWSVLVNDVNLTSMVTFTPIANPTITEEENQTFYANTSNIDTNKANISMKWYLNGEIVSTSDNYTFVANYSSSGVYNVTLNITDGQHYRISEWLLTVTDVHRLTSVYPVLTYPAINENESYTFNITTSSPSIYPPNITWYVNGIPQSFLENYTFVSNYTSAGAYNITANVVDMESNFTYTWNLTVSDVNCLQLISTTLVVGNQTFNENQTYMFVPDVAWLNWTSLSFKWYLNGTLVSTSQNYTFATNYSSASAYVLRLNIADSNYSADFTWNITVVDTPRPPIIQSADPSINDCLLLEGSSQTFNIIVTDTTDYSPSIYWYLDGNLVSTSTSFVFETNYSSAGFYNLTVNVTGSEGNATKNWFAEVRDLNRPPITTRSPVTDNITINETTNVIFTIRATDLDGDMITINWSLDGVLIPSAYETYSYIPNYVSAGIHNVTVNISDGKSKIVYEWNITVMNVNRKPTIINYIPTSSPTIIECENRTFNISAVDPDGDQTITNWYLDDILVAANSTAYEFDTDYSSAKTYVLIARITDGELEVSHSWLITVLNNNRPPEIKSVTPANPNISISDGDTVTFTAESSDADGTVPIMKWYLDDALVGIGTTCVYNADFNSSGTRIFTLLVTDGEDSERNIWWMNITDINRVPIIYKTMPSATPVTITGGEMNFSVEVMDLDNDALSFYWYLNGTAVSNFKNYTMQFNRSSSKIYNLTVIVSDNKSNTSYYWTLYVNISNKRPIATIVSINPSNATLKQNIEFVGNGTDEDGIVTGYQWRSSIDGILNNSKNFNTSNLSPGKHAIYLKVKDNDSEWSDEVNSTVSINLSQETTTPAAPPQKVNNIITIGIVAGTVTLIVLIPVFYIITVRKAPTKKGLVSETSKPIKKVVKKRKRPKTRFCAHCKKEIPRELIEVGWAECPHCGKEWESPHK